MTLIKTSILSFIATFFRLLSGLVINKAIALYIGPAGLATIGQFQNFTQVVLTLAQGGINNGVTKYNAELMAENKNISVLNSTAIRISISASVFVGTLMIIFATYLSEYIFKNSEYGYVFIIFGITIVFFVLNQLLLSILNGLKEIRTFIGINISQSVYSLFFTSLAIFFGGLNGALIAMVTNQSMIFLSVLWRLRKHAIIKFDLFKEMFDHKTAKSLIKYSLMTFTTVAAVPITNFILRNYIGNHIGWQQAGYWQAIWYISSMYLMVITTALNIYYLPRLSEIKEKRELRVELINGYKIIFPIVIMSALMIYAIKEYITFILFSKDFLPMIELFRWQLVGDVLKIAAWLLSYLMLAKAMVKEFIVTEILFSISFILISILFINIYGLVGITYGFAVNYLLYLFAMFVLLRHKIIN